MKRCLINVRGGLGKNVMLTALMPELAEVYDEIYVVSPYFDVFKACSYVTDAFPPGQPSLYQLVDKDTVVFSHDPYDSDTFIKKKCHLFNAWRELFGLKVRPQSDADIPCLDNIENEYPQIAKLRDQFLEQIGEKFILIQFCGGQSPLDGGAHPYDDHAEAIKRNYYKGQELIKKLKIQYPNAKIIHYSLPNEPSYEGADKLTINVAQDQQSITPYLLYPLLAEKALKVVCTDSSLQHLATGHCKDITVIWGETRPEHFGYTCNKNIAAKGVINSQPYFVPLGVSPAIVRFPTPSEVIDSVISGDIMEEANND